MANDPYDTVTDKQSVLGPTLRFKGELSADEDLVIHGQVEGTIGPTPRVTIGAQAKIKANINARRVVVEGNVDGDLNAETSVLVRETGTVNGNIQAPSVSIQEGAKFNGSVKMTAAKETAKESKDTGSSATLRTGTGV